MADETTARKIAMKLDINGQNFQTEDGVELRTLAEEEEAEIRQNEPYINHEGDYGNFDELFLFRDGSYIAV